MRYAKIALGLGLLVLCVIVGALIPIGKGSAVVIGFVVGLVLCYFVLSRKRLWFTSAQEPEQVDQKALEEKTQGMREAHINDMESIERIWRN